MPQPPSMFSSVAPGMGGSAGAIDPAMIQMALQAVPGNTGGPSPYPPPRQAGPPGSDPMAASQGGPPSYGAVPQQQDPNAQQQADRVQQLVMLLMNQNSKLNPDMLMLLAGMGANILLDNMGKPPVTKAHRSNAELQAQ